MSSAPSATGNLAADDAAAAAASNSANDTGLVTGMTNLAVTGTTAIAALNDSTGATQSTVFNGVNNPMAFTVQPGSVENPFGPSSGSGAVPSKKEVMSRSWRSGSGSGSKSGSGSNASVTSIDANNQFVVNTFTSSTGRYVGVSMIRAEDAQRYYLPSDCVFVANLTQGESELTLMTEVTKVFREFGSVFVKIRRDRRNMPFAFCQYTNNEDAQRALVQAKDRIICGRGCRTEKAKAQRTYFIERRSGPTITLDEAEELVKTYGPLETRGGLTTDEREKLRIENDGALVKFVTYDEGKTAFDAFRTNETYKLTIIGDHKSHGNGKAVTSYRRNSGCRSGFSDAAQRAFLERYEVDRRSVFVGNLSVNTSEEVLREVFAQYGDIRNVSRVENVSKFEPFDKFAFAFIEFHDAASVHHAIKGKHGSELDGKTIRVLLKDSESSKAHRAQRSVSSGAVATPARRPQEPISPPPTQMPPQYTAPVAYTPPNTAPQYFFTPQSQMVYTPIPQYYGPPMYNTGYGAYPATGSPNQQYEVYAAAQQQSQQDWYFQHYMAVQRQYYASLATPQSSSSGFGTGSDVQVDNFEAEDRSATPTPAGNGVVSSSMVSE